MSISPINFSRYTQLMGTMATSNQVDSLQTQIQTVEQQLSTQDKFSQPSQDPGDASIVMGLQRSLDAQNQYLSNVQSSQSQLSQVDSSLSSLTSLVTQATTIASQSIGTGVSSEERTAFAEQIQTLSSQSLSIANTQFEGGYLFGGSKSTQQPYVSVNGGVQFVGSSTVLQNTATTDTLLAFQVSGDSVFGAAGQVTGSAISPALTPSTRISDLAGASGNGVKLGTIQISNGATTAKVDLSKADTVQDVINSINAAGVGGITAAVSGNHLVLSGGALDNISVTDTGGGTAAADLGIRQATGGGAGASLVGSSTQPKVTVLTPLSALNGGAGIDTTHGLKITNGQNSATVNLSSATTVGDLVNAVNASATFVKAQINSAGNGINIVNTVQGTNLSVGENGGTTAADLGVRSFSPSTLLSSLNGGAGVGTATGGGADFQITSIGGTSFTVSIAGAKTVQDVINDINTASGSSGVSAVFATTGNGIVLTDSSSGSGTLTVTPQNASTAAGDLGLTAPASGNTITGSDVNAVQSQGLFADLASLQKALTNNDTAGITAAAQALQNDSQRVTDTRGQAGAQVQQLQDLQSTLTGRNTATQAMITQLQGTDMASAATTFTMLQTALQGSLQAAAKSLNLSLLNFIA
jgi:flagellar hook-associated protein 3 FlgL